MCGIAGAIGLQGLSVPTDVVEAMTRALAHRGPDAQKVQRLTDSIVFGHTRLAIIDLRSCANQPMQYKNACITYNGEVYNFKALQQLCAGSATELVTTGDTEVVLRLLDQQGLAALDLLDGFFAFAFFDGQQVLLVRDRFGQKPLYYSVQNGVVYFASEIKALCRVIRPKTLRESCAEYLKYYRFSPDLSPFEEIQMLRPGTALTIDPDSGRQEFTTWYAVQKNIAGDKASHYLTISSEERVRHTETLIKHSIEKRLQADVPVGVLCSGGLDSSLIASIAKQSREIMLFHVDVVGKSETRYARELARYLQCPLHTIRWDESLFARYEKPALLACEYPLVHPNNTALLAIAHAAAEKGVSVLLGGEGADELFGGYVHHQRYYYIQKIASYLGSWCAQFLSGSKTPAARWKQHTRGPDRSIEFSIQRFVSSLEEHYQSYPDSKYLAFLLSDFLTYLQPLLLRGDKITMAAGVELRLPFLDRELVEWALGLPASDRLQKACLRTIANSYLPATIITRKKMGFALPDSFRTSTAGQLNESEYILRSLHILQESLCGFDESSFTTYHH